MKVITTNLLNRFYKNGVKPIKDALAQKLDTSKVISNLNTTVAGYALDARQGKALNDKISDLDKKMYYMGDWQQINTNNYTAPKDGFVCLWWRPNDGSKPVTFANLKDVTTDRFIAAGVTLEGLPVMINAPIKKGHVVKYDYGAVGPHYFYFIPFEK